MTLSVEAPKCHEMEVINIDRILMEEVGQCGRFQMRVIALCFLLALIAGANANIYLFTFDKVSTRCVIPECESSSSPSNFSPSWVREAIPTSGGSFDKCHRFAPVSIHNISDTCSGDLFDPNSSVECEEYVYEHKNSAIFEYNLACDNWRPNLVGSLIATGNILALPLGGFVADRWGRRVALASSAVSMACISSTLYFANTFNSYVVIGFVGAILGGSYYTNAYILAVECVGLKHRVAVSATMSSTAAFGRIVAALIMWTGIYWRNLILVIGCPLFIAVFYYWAAPESIRWLLSKNRHDDAKKSLNKAAEVNGNSLSDRTIQSLTSGVKSTKVKESGTSEPWLVYLVFKHKPILLRCIVTPIWWFVTVFVFYGLQISSARISIIGNRFLNYSLVSAVAIPGFWIAVVLSDRVGRKPLLMVAFWICGASQLAFILIPKGNYWLALVVYLIGKLTISTCNTLNYIYTAELYPTRYRASLLSFSSAVGRLGTVLAPLAPALAAEIWEYLPFAIFGSMAFLASFLVPLVPETLGTTLPDTMEEAVNLGKDQESCGILQTLRRLVFRRKCYTVQCKQI